MISLGHPTVEGNKEIISPWMSKSMKLLRRVLFGIRLKIEFNIGKSSSKRLAI
jgi:hypothetical protein